MQSGLQIRVPSLPDSQFTEALAPGAATALYDVQLPRAAYGRSLVQTLLIQSVDNCAWEVNWFSSSDGTAVTPGADTWLGRWQFVEADGEQIGATGLYRYLVPAIDQPYEDLENANVDGPQYLHLVLVNRSAGTSKGAAAAGAIKITVILEPLAENA